MFFFVKQKTAYEMRISDWSSDVCSSDLARVDADLLADALGDLDHDLGVLTQERLGVLPALAELLALVGVPGTRLLHEAEVDADVEERALAADALAVHDVERSEERRVGEECVSTGSTGWSR